jgi:predicted RNase H-like nuclease (RuvC/YqgF family)
LAEEVVQEEHLVEEGIEQAVEEADATDTEAMIAQGDEELEKANARLAELERAVADRDTEIASLKQIGDEAEALLSTLNQSLAGAVAGYRALVLQANPNVIEEMIRGDSIEAINQSLEQAKAVVNRVRQGVEAEVALSRFPAGAPERTTGDLSALSPREKIRHGMGSVFS